MTLLERLALRLSVGKRRGRVASAKAAIEALLDGEVPGRMARDRVPGLVVVVRFADGTEIQKAIGSAGSNGPIRLDSRFPGGSVYKSIAALCALSLVESRMLSLDEPVWKRARTWELPVSRRGGHSIEGVTLRRLLSHSAGLDEVLYGRGPIGPLPCARDLLALAESDGRHMHLACAPGTEFRYSSAGYLLVQLLIEEATRAPYGDVVRERVLLPLGMRASVYGPTQEVAEHVVTGHDAQGRALPTTYSLAAVEGLFTTAGDLATFAAALLPGPQGEPAGRGVVTPTMCREMLTSQVAHPNGDGWGLGFRVKKEAADVRFEQVGRDAGTIGQFLGFVRRRITAAIYCNTDAGNDLVRGLARDIRHLLHRIPV